MRLFYILSMTFNGKFSLVYSVVQNSRTKNNKLNFDHSCTVMRKY